MPRQNEIISSRKQNALTNVEKKSRNIPTIWRVHSAINKLERHTISALNKPMFFVVLSTETVIFRNLLNLNNLKWKMFYASLYCCCWYYFNHIIFVFGFNFTKLVRLNHDYVCLELVELIVWWKYVSINVDQDDGKQRGEMINRVYCHTWIFINGTNWLGKIIIASNGRWDNFIAGRRCDGIGFG